MKTIWAVVIMSAMAFVGFFAGISISNSDTFGLGTAILFAWISGIGCIIQAINHHPHDTE